MCELRQYRHPEPDIGLDHSQLFFACLSFIVSFCSHHELVSGGVGKWDGGWGSLFFFFSRKQKDQVSKVELHNRTYTVGHVMYNTYNVLYCYLATFALSGVIKPQETQICC